MKFSRIFFNLIVPLFIVSTITLAAFGRTIGSYFLEDDFGEILYVSQIFSGDWHKVVANFTGNYMEIPTMKVYRPFLLLSLMFDYAIWHTKAYGYFITNILFLIGAAMMLYAVLRELTKTWGNRRSLLFALFAAALFACSPLHCESVSLMVGRVDIICAFFYLLALWGFVRKGDGDHPFLFVLSLLSFWAALLTKEMAIGLPVVLTAIGFLLPDNITKKTRETGIYAGERLKENIFQRLQLALSISLPAWISTIGYLLLRIVTLGTCFGGYVGSVGASQFSHIFEKWTDLDTIFQILFPLNAAVFGDQNIYHSLLSALYVFLAALVLFKIFMRGIPATWLLLLSIWILTTLAPIYQLWGLGFNLEGARFVFFLTIPLAVIFPLLIFAPRKADPANVYAFGVGDKRKIEVALIALGSVALTCLIVLEAKIGAKNNIPWMHAGKQTRALLEEGQKLAEGLPGGQKAIVLGIPDQLDGAHVIYNGMTFNFLMTPPFARSYLADRFITFSPILFGKGELINTQRFKQQLQRPDLAGVYLWQKDKRVFEVLSLPAYKQAIEVDKPFMLPFPSDKDKLFPFTRERGHWRIENNYVNVSQAEKGSGIMIGPLDINPFAYGQLEMRAVTDPIVSADRIETFWEGQCKENGPGLENRGRGLSRQSVVSLLPAGLKVPVAEGKSTEIIYRFRLSQYWRWFTQGNLKYLWLEFPPTQSIIFKDICLMPDSNLMPKLSVADLQADNTGVYTVGKKGFTLQIDAGKIDNCIGAKLEFSKPNYFFENLTNSHESALFFSMNVASPSAAQYVSGKFFPSPGYYQIRAIGLDKDGLAEGEWSDPLTVKFDSGLL